MAFICLSVVFAFILLFPLYGFVVYFVDPDRLAQVRPLKVIAAVPFFVLMGCCLDGCSGGRSRSSH
jgi:TRAP-type mannitol/chloroaromatic compound transport system permease large subunit